MWKTAKRAYFAVEKSLLRGVADVGRLVKLKGIQIVTIQTRIYKKNAVSSDLPKNCHSALFRLYNYSLGLKKILIQIFLVNAI